MHSKQASVKNKIKSINIVYNRVLEDAFLAKKQAFRQCGIKDEEIFAFHGTPFANVNSILRTNLQYQNVARAHGQAHGPGNYFSKFPDVSLGYGQGLILFRVLPWKEYEGSERDIPAGFNTKKVSGDNQGFGVMLIIKDSNQFLPIAHYELERAA